MTVSGVRGEDGQACAHIEDFLCPEGCTCRCRTCFKRRVSPLANKIGATLFGPGGRFSKGAS